MTISAISDKQKIDGLLTNIIGEYVWSVRLADYRILQMEFGDPHLRIAEPQVPFEPSERIAGLLGRRTVTPTGRWSLFIEGGHWSVTTAGHETARTSSDVVEMEQCLRALSGQKVVAACVSQDGTTLSLDFDLCGCLVIEDACQEPDQWTLFSEGDKTLSYNGRLGLLLEASDN